MQGEVAFLDFLREARAGEGRGNEELVRAIVPLLDQLQSVHDQGMVEPLDGVDRLFADGGHLWFHSADATPPTLATQGLRAVERRKGDGIDVVRGGEIDIDIPRQTPHGSGVEHRARPDHQPVQRRRLVLPALPPI